MCCLLLFITYINYTNLAKSLTNFQQFKLKFIKIVLLCILKSNRYLVFQMDHFKVPADTTQSCSRSIA